MALEVSGSNQVSEQPNLSLEVEVDPRTVAYCIGRGKSNLRDIGEQVLEKTGHQVNIKYITPRNQEWGYFSVRSKDDSSITFAKDLLRESEQKFLANQLDRRIHPTSPSFQVKIPKSEGRVSFNRHNSNKNQGSRVPRKYRNASHSRHLGPINHANKPYPNQFSKTRPGQSQKPYHNYNQHKPHHQPNHRKPGRQSLDNYQHKREFNGRRRNEELPTHFSWED